MILPFRKPVSSAFFSGAAADAAGALVSPPVFAVCAGAADFAASLFFASGCAPGAAFAGAGAAEAETSGVSFFTSAAGASFVSFAGDAAVSFSGAVRSGAAFAAASAGLGAISGTGVSAPVAGASVRGAALTGWPAG